MKIRDLDLNIQITGEGTPFIWAHALMASVEGEDMLDWFGWQSFPKNIKLIRYDARGHGKSQGSNKPVDYYWKNLGVDQLAVADAVGAQKFIAGGASMGCASTLFAAVQAPERIEALVLTLAPNAWETSPSQMKNVKVTSAFANLLAPFAGMIMTNMMKRNKDTLLPKWMTQAHPELLEKMAVGMGSFNQKTASCLMRAGPGSDIPSREEIATLVDIPTIILGWVDDSVHPASTSKELHRILPKSELFIANGYEESRTFPKRIRDFVSKFA